MNEIKLNCPAETGRKHKRLKTDDKVAYGIAIVGVPLVALWLVWLPRGTGQSSRKSYESRPIPNHPERKNGFFPKRKD
jgi:hypothetical protein